MFFRVLSVFSCLMFSITVSAASFLKTPKYNPVIEPYVSYLKSHPLSPKEYLLKLFETNDVVVLAERDHTEINEWNLILELLSDPEINSRVGYLITEFGFANQQSQLEKFLNSSSRDDQLGLNILRDYGFSLGGWDRNAIFNFMKSFWALNQSLDANHRIKWLFGDIPWIWDGMTKENYDAAMGVINFARDEMMSSQIRQKMMAILKSHDPRSKVLVIMNTRHAFKVPMKLGDDIYLDNMTASLCRFFPTFNRTASVMLNYVHSYMDENTKKNIFEPVQDGKWDAAFAVMGDIPQAVSFKDSLFGNSKFDYLGNIYLNVNYGDVFNGMIFYQPLKNQVVMEDIPDFFNSEFETLARSRAASIGQNAEIEELLKNRRDYPENYGRRRAFTDDQLKSIQKWLVY